MANIAQPRPADIRRPWWPLPLLLFSLLLGGTNVALSERAPVILVFDVVMLALVCVLSVEMVFGQYWPDLTDTTFLSIAVVCLLAHMMSSFANPNDIFKSLVSTKVFAFGILVYVLAFLPGYERKILSTLVLFGGVTGLMLLYGFVSGWSAVFEGEDTARALKNLVELPMGQHNYIAAILVFLFPIGAGQAKRERGARRWIAGVACAFMLLGLFIAMSRGAFLALIASAVLSLPLMLRAGLKFKHIAIVVVVLAAVLLLLPDEMVSANTVLLMERINQPDFDRFDIYRLAWNAFLENPLLGVGPGQIVNLTAALSIDSIRLTAHNFVLNSLSELGLVGAIPYFALVGLVVVRTYRLAARTLTAVPLGLWVGLLATMLANIVDVPFAGQHYLALFCTIAALVKLLSRDFQGEAITPQAEAKGTV